MLAQGAGFLPPTRETWIAFSVLGSMTNPYPVIVDFWGVSWQMGICSHCFLNNNKKVSSNKDDLPITRNVINIAIIVQKSPETYSPNTCLDTVVGDEDPMAKKQVWPLSS